MNVNECTDRYHPFLKSILTPPRLQHSVAVMHVMGELADIYSLDRPRAMTAGLLHDAARDMALERQLELAQEGAISLSHPCERHPVYLHALVGAYLVSKDLAITDRLILDAISTHSYAGHGDNLDTLFYRCLRSADILAPIQDWKGKRKLRSVVYAGRIEEAALLQCGWLIEFFQERGIPVHPNLVKNLKTLTAKLDVASSFFERW